MDKFTRRTADLTNNDADKALNSETHTPLENAEGFGCPFSAYECDRHCSSKGYRGGYCRGIVRQTCACY